MTNQQQPLIPPPEMVQLWVDLLEVRSDQDVFSLAAQWGADQELEACCEWLPSDLTIDGQDLRSVRRPEPPSLKEQALNQLDAIQLDLNRANIYGANTDTIRKALESIND